MTFRTEELPVEWARWWLWLWAAIVAALVAGAFVVPFGPWSIAAAVGFGVPEGLALLAHRDPYPPLTHVTRHFVPRWLTFTTIGFLVGSIGAHWFLGAGRRLAFGALLALYTWALDHFTVTYDG